MNNLTPEQQIMKYQEMNQDYETFKSDSILLKKLQKFLLGFLPDAMMMKHLKTKKLVMRDYKFNE